MKIRKNGSSENITVIETRDPEIIAGIKKSDKITDKFLKIIITVLIYLISAFLSVFLIYLASSKIMPYIGVFIAGNFGLTFETNILEIFILYFFPMAVICIVLSYFLIQSVKYIIRTLNVFRDKIIKRLTSKKEQL